jgi:hypothetical protein
VLVAAYSPAGAASLYLGQIDPTNAMLAVAFIGALLAGRQLTAGFFLAMLCLIKMMPVFLILPLMLRRRWVVLAGWLGFMVGYALVLAVTGRLGHEWFFVSTMAPEIPFHWREISGSMHRALLRFVLPEGWHENRARFDLIAGIVTVGLIGVYGATMVALARRRLTTLRLMECGLLFVPLFSPLFESHHMAWALPVMLLHARRWLMERISRGFALIFGVGWIIVAQDYSFMNLLQDASGHYRFYVMIGAVALCATAVIDAASNPSTPDELAPESRATA